MMKKVLITITISILLLSVNCFSQSVDTLYEVAAWQGFRPSAISYTFDDNWKNQLDVAVPIFDEFDFKTTLFTITNYYPVADWIKLQSAASNGHEIASHTVTHPYFNELSDSQLTLELQYSQAVIDSKITGQKCLTIAYPYCVTGNPSLIKEYYIAGRGCQGFIETRTPADFMHISSVICGPQGDVKTEEDFKIWADNAVYYGGWCVYLLHGIDDDGGYSALSSSILRASLQYLDDNPEKFWVATFIDVVKYIKERDAISVKEISSTENSFLFSVTDTLDNSLYNVPVTIRRELPPAIVSAVVKQNGELIESKIVEIYSTKYIIFDIVPDGGNILIMDEELTEAEEQASSEKSFSLYQNYPNPFNPSTNISYYLEYGTDVEMKLYDILGHEVITMVNEHQSAGMHTFEFTPERLSSGVYFYKLKAGDYINIKKLLLLQ